MSRSPGGCGGGSGAEATASIRRSGGGGCSTVGSEDVSTGVRRRTVPPSPTASVNVRISAERGGGGAGALSGFSSSAIIRWIFLRVLFIDRLGVTAAVDIYLNLFF